MAFPITASSPLRFVGALPLKADVVVIGGGVIGVMTAWHLKTRGLSVVLCEKGRIAGEQSSRNWGWVRQQGRDAAELPIMMDASRMWDSLGGEAGADLGFRRTGVLYVARTDKDQAEHEAFMDLARQHQLDTRLLSAAEVRAMLTGAAEAWPGGLKGGLWTASDGRAEPWLAVPALAAAAARRGVTVVEGCAVRGIERAAGRVSGVVTEKGRVVCDAVVLAGGAWSSLFLRANGATIPQLSVISTVAQTVPMPEIFPGAMSDGAFAFRRRLDGGYSIAPGDFHEFHLGPDAFRNLRAFLPEVMANPFGRRYLPLSPAGYPDGWRTPRAWALDRPSPFEAVRILNPRPNLAALGRVQAAFAQAFPGLGRPQIATAWAGMIDTMPDVVPVVDHVPGLPGLTVATGMSGHGFGIGPGFGRVVADLVTGHPPGHDLARFRFSRFADGSALASGPSL